MSTSSTPAEAHSTQIRVFPNAAESPAVNVAKGAWVYDFATSQMPNKPFTAGLFIKDAEAQAGNFTNWPNTEWKYILEGEWHIIQNGEKLIGRPGDVVFVPQGADYTSLPNPFKAFFVANRPGAVHRPYKM